MLPNQDVPKEYSKSINAVTHFIQNNLNDNLSLKNLSLVANYSPFHFQRIFKQVTGEVPQAIHRTHAIGNRRALVDHTVGKIH